MYNEIFSSRNTIRFWVLIGLLSKKIYEFHEYTISRRGEGEGEKRKKCILSATSYNNLQLLRVTGGLQELPNFPGSRMNVIKD